MENKYEQMASTQQGKHQLKQFKNKQQLKKEVNKFPANPWLYMCMLQITTAAGGM